MSAEAPFEPERLVGALNAAGVRYVIVGGLAVGTHGVIRATRDLDLVPAPDRENAERLAVVLRSLGAKHPIVGRITADLLSHPVSLKLTTVAGEVHILNRMPGTPPFAALEAERLAVDLGEGVVAPICSLEHLKTMKSASSRPRDAIDLAELDALHGPE